MKCNHKTAAIRLLSLILMLSMCLSFLGAAAPPGETEEQTEPIPQLESVTPEELPPDIIPEAEEPPSSDPPKVTDTENGSDLQTEPADPTDPDPEKETDQVPQPEKESEKKPEKNTEKNPEKQPEEQPLADPTDPTKELPQENPETLTALSWSWLYEDPELSDILAKEADTGNYILDIAQAETPLEDVLFVLPQAVRFTLSDNTELTLTVASWETDYPETGISATEQAVDFLFTPVFEDQPPVMEDQIPGPGFLARVAGAEGAKALIERKVSQNVNFYVFKDYKRVKLSSANVDCLTFSDDGYKRRYIKAEDLETIYGAYGFRAEDLKAGTYYFGHANEKRNFWNDPDEVWMAESKDGYAPITNEDTTTGVYYLPRQSLKDLNSGHNYTEFSNKGSGYDGFLSTVPFGKMKIHYDINLQHTPVNPEYESPQIQGDSTYDEITNRDHTVLPALPSYYYSYTSDGKKYLGKVSFVTWELEGGTQTFAPGTVISIDQYKNQELNLKAQWQVERATADDKKGPMVNFYVGLFPNLEGDDKFQASGDAKFYTKSVYTADCGVRAENYGSATILGGNDNDHKTLEQCHNEVMQL